MSGLTEFQTDVARLFFSLPASDGFLLAGGGALLVSGLTTRPTEDLDFFGERGRFQRNHEDASNRGNQANDQKWFGDQIMRPDGDAHRVQNLHQHEHNQ